MDTTRQNKLSKWLITFLCLNVQLNFKGPSVITARKRSLGQGNVFTGVCLSIGEYDVTSCLVVWFHVHSKGSVSVGESASRWVGQTSLPPETEKQVVRILLECFLVKLEICTLNRFVTGSAFVISSNGWHSKWLIKY